MASVLKGGSVHVFKTEPFQTVVSELRARKHVRGIEDPPNLHLLNSVEAGLEVHSADNGTFQRCEYFLALHCDASSRVL